MSTLVKFNTVAALRANTASGALAVLNGYHTIGDRGQGNVWLNTADATSSDNNGTIFADATGNRWYREVSPYLTPEYFGAVGDGSTDDQTPFDNAIATTSSAGAKILLFPMSRYYLSKGLNVGVNVTISGSYVVPEMTQYTDGYNFLALGSTIIIDGTQTITLQNGAALEGVFVHRSGMTVETQLSPMLAQLKLFSGTAVTMAGSGNSVIGCAFLGFDLAIQSFSGSGTTVRPVIERVRIDCNSGLSIQNVGDLGYINNVHCWRFYTQSLSGGPTQANKAAFQRPKTAFSYAANASGMRSHDLFAFGYATAFSVDATSVLRFFDCGSDGLDLPPNTLIGWSFTGVTTDIILYGCASSSCATSYLVNVSPDSNDELSVQFIGCSSFSPNTQNHMSVQQGNVRLHNCHFRYGSTSAGTVGLNVTTGAGKVFLHDCTFEEVTKPIAISQASYTNLDWGGNYYVNCPNMDTLPWTPRLQFGGSSTGMSYSGVGGSLSIFNGIATIYAAFGLTNAGTSTGVATLSGLPITINSAAGGGQPFIYGSMIGLTGPIIASINLGSSAIGFFEANSSGLAPITNANFSNQGYINFAITARP